MDFVPGGCNGIAIFLICAELGEGINENRRFSIIYFGIDFERKIYVLNAF